MLYPIIVLSSAVPSGRPSAPMWIVVCPLNVIALEILSVLGQAAFPAGMITVSPSTAEPMALLTSEREGLRAIMGFGCAAPEAAKRSAARRTLRFRTL